MNLLAVAIFNFNFTFGKKKYIARVVREEIQLRDKNKRPTRLGYVKINTLYENNGIKNVIKISCYAVLCITR